MLTKLINLSKNTAYSCMLFFMVLVPTSCKKYVDIKRNSSQNTIQSSKDCELLLDNYTVMNTTSPSDGQVSADDYFVTDQGYLNSTINDELRNLYSWAPTAIRSLAAPQWQGPYHTIYIANLVMENIEKLRGKEDVETLNKLRGAALFFRAYTFWQVAQIYCPTYDPSTSNLDPGIPLKLTSDINDKSTRGTVKQTYDRIIQDLEEASNLLSTTSSVVTRPNKASAYGMLARVYLSMDNYSGALDNATKALNLNGQLIDYNTVSTTSSTPFTRFNKEVIFHSLMIASPILVPGAANNNIAKIDRNLFSSYSNNDLRRLIFFKQNTASVTVPDPSQSTGTRSVTVPDGTYRFTGNYEPVTNATFFNGIAVDEVLLIRAECFARSNDPSAAMADLNTLLKTRFVNTSTNPYQNLGTSTGTEALSIILNERRKELLMRGLRWTDLRRLNKEERFKKELNRNTLIISPIVSGIYPNHSITFDYTPARVNTLPANDLRYTLLIPNDVILNSSIQQNIR